jgi:glycogen operon protein
MRLRLDAAGGMAAGDVTLNELLKHAQAQFHGTKLGQPDWGETSHSLAVTLRAAPAHLVLYLMMNAYWEPLDFELPAMVDVGRQWRRLIDTALPAPDDIGAFRDAPPVSSLAYRAQPRSVVLLAAELN